MTSIYLGTAAKPSTDRALSDVRAYLLAIPDLPGILGRAIRKALDEVIDGARTGRYSVEQLEKTEKTYIGTKIEIILRRELDLGRGKRLDNLICNYEVDTKWTMAGTWMVPIEAFGELCLLVTADDHAGTCSLGLLRMTPDVLRSGANQDKKKSVSAHGKSLITWLVKDKMPRNFMLDLEPDIRKRILASTSGREAIKILFENVTGQLIPRSVIEQVARQKDPLKRAREAKEILAQKGIRVLCATYKSDCDEFPRNGFPKFADGDWLSVYVTQPRN